MSNRFMVYLNWIHCAVVMFHAQYAPSSPVHRLVPQIFGCEFRFSICFFTVSASTSLHSGAAYGATKWLQKTNKQIHIVHASIWCPDRGNWTMSNCRLDDNIRLNGHQFVRWCHRNGHWTRTTSTGIFSLDSHNTHRLRVKWSHLCCHRPWSAELDDGTVAIIKTKTSVLQSTYWICVETNKTEWSHNRCGKWTEPECAHHYISNRLCQRNKKIQFPISDVKKIIFSIFRIEIPSNHISPILTGHKQYGREQWQKTIINKFHSSGNTIIINWNIQTVDFVFSLHWMEFKNINYVMDRSTKLTFVFSPFKWICDWHSEPRSAFAMISFRYSTPQSQLIN